MITEEHIMQLHNEEINMRHIDTDTIFFDIETTGFSPATSHLYMIGCSFYCDEQFHSIQWFDDLGTLEGEAALLDAFAALVTDFHKCISFNGSTFDFPYLTRKYASHKLKCPLEHLVHSDIYKLVRPFKDLFHMENLKQKSLEAFLGIHREDTYSGGELISVYHNYLKHPSDDQYQKLMCHNYEDLQGMLMLTPVYAYMDLFSDVQKVLSSAITETALVLRFSCASPVPSPLDIENELGHLQVAGARGTMTVPVRKDTLKFFPKDYKNYYYLPFEDTAIHKSIAAFVEPEYRKKATKETCYIKKSDCFIPQFNHLFEPEYKTTAASKITFITLDLVREDQEVRQTYLMNLLSSFVPH